MFLFFDMSFNLIYFILRLYFLVDKYYIFSINGGKLKKYILKDNLQNVASNLDKPQRQNLILNLFHKIKPPNLGIAKNFFVIVCISISVILLKTCFSFNFFISNFLYINILGKNIDLISLFKEYIAYIKIIYFISYSFVIFDFTILLYSKIIKLNKNNNNLKPIEFPYINLYSKENKTITMSKKGLMQNILITGSIGSGKTSCAISNILSELLSCYVFGLVIDIKGNYIDIVRNIAKVYNLSDKVVEISLSSDYKYNPLACNISNFELASRLNHVLKILSNKNESDSYWLDKAEGYIRDFITIMRGYTNNINFHELHMLVINKEYLYSKLEVIKNKILKNKFNDDELFDIKSAILNIKNEYLKLDERTIGIIKSEITRITNIFISNSKIYNQFCTSSQNIDFEQDKIYVLSLDIGKNKQLAKIISTYLKLEFQSQILSRKNIKKPIFFICDEYQEIANEQDANFFALSREYECINMVSMQSYSSLLNATNSESATKVIIQNLVNKICFRNDDIYTVSEIIKYIGKEVKKYETVNYSESSQNSKFSIVSNNFRNYKSGLSKSLSYADKIDYSLNEEYFTNTLKTFEALIFFSDGKKMNIVKKFNLKRWDENRN